MFKGILITKDESGYKAAVQQIDDAVLPEGDVTVRVEYSTLNYKDGLAHHRQVAGGAPASRWCRASTSPARSSSESTPPGRPATGGAQRLGRRRDALGRPGRRAPGSRATGWCRCRRRSRARQAMAIGTAGYTAMLCVLALERHGVTPADGEILVTGANGGVGSVAIALLSKLGYTVVASTGRPAEAEYLKALGAAEVIDRDELSAPGKPLGKERWAGVVDTVGSHTLANACADDQVSRRGRRLRPGRGMDFPATVAPFILRGVTLYGIDSVMAPIGGRQEAWARLARDLDVAKLDAMTTEIGLSEAIATGARLLEGKVRGRVVVDISR